MLVNDFPVEIIPAFAFVQNNGICRDEIFLLLFQEEINRIFNFRLNGKGRIFE